MVRAKNYETASTFVKVSREKLSLLFFQKRCRFNTQITKMSLNSEVSSAFALRYHRHRFVPDCTNSKIATKSRFILTILANVKHVEVW